MNMNINCILKILKNKADCAYIYAECGFLKIYFVFGCTESSLLQAFSSESKRAIHCGVQASHCGGFSYCRA